MTIRCTWRVGASEHRRSRHCHVIGAGRAGVELCSTARFLAYFAALNLIDDAGYSAISAGALFEAATRAEQIARNQYLAGIIGYSDLIVVQTNSLAARSAAAQAITDRQSAAIALLQVIGGAW
ncbi:MAG: TolC family protein [Proteobacteria bacterium]|nr:TolC family protein [Pseudomonadota bacterium]